MSRPQTARVSAGEEITVMFGGTEGCLTQIFEHAPELPSQACCAGVTTMLGPLAAEIRTHPSLNAAMLAADDLSGSTGFGSVEHDFAVDVELRHGKGVIVVRVCTPFGGQGGYAEFRLTTDQSFLGATLRDLDALLRAFPTYDSARIEHMPVIRLDEHQLFDTLRSRSSALPCDSRHERAPRATR